MCIQVEVTMIGISAKPCSCCKHPLAGKPVAGRFNCMGINNDGKNVTAGTVSVTREDAGVSVHALWTPYPTEPDLEAARAACERLHSETIFPAASTSGAVSWGAEAASHTDGPLSGLCTLLQKTRLIDDLDICIARFAEQHFATPYQMTLFRDMILLLTIMMWHAYRSKRRLSDCS